LIGDSCLSAVVGIGKCGGHFGHKWRRRRSRHHSVGVALQTRRADSEQMARKRCADGEWTEHVRCANDATNEVANRAATTMWNKKVTWLF